MKKESVIKIKLFTLKMKTCIGLSCFYLNLLHISVAIPLFRHGILTEESRTALNYVRLIGVPYISEALETLKVPDVSATTDSPIGKFGYKISEISLHDVAIPKSNLTISQSKGLTISATNATITINAKWKYRQYGWPHISDSGTCNIRMDHIMLQVTLKVDTANESYPKMETSECSLKIGHMKIRFHGGASWLYNVFADSISKDIKGILEKLVITEMRSAIDKEGNKILNTFPEKIRRVQQYLRTEQENEVEDEEY